MRAFCLAYRHIRTAVISVYIEPSRLLSASRHYSKIYTKTGDKGTSALFTGIRKPKDDAVFNALGTTDELSSAIGVAAEFCRDANLDLEEQFQQIQCILQDVGSNVATPLSSAREAHLKRVEFSKEYVHLLERWIDEMTAQLPPLKNFILPDGVSAHWQDICTIPHQLGPSQEGHSQSMPQSPLTIPMHYREASRLPIFTWPGQYAAEQKERWCISTLANRLCYTTSIGALHKMVIPDGCHKAMTKSQCTSKVLKLTPLSKAGEIDSSTFIFINRLSDYLFTAARFAAMKEGREEKIYRRIAPVDHEK